MAAESKNKVSKMPYHKNLIRSMTRLRYKGKRKVTAAKSIVGRTVDRIMPRRAMARVRGGLRKYSTSAAHAAKAAVPQKASSGIVFRGAHGISK